MSDAFTRIFQPDPEESWEDEEVQYYPGSKTPIPEHLPPPTAKPVDEDPWDTNPKVLLLGGVETEFFPLGALGKALGKSSKTMREWERTGIIPKARYRTAKGYRLYTRAQIEGIRRIAAEEGVLTWKPATIKGSNFTEKVVILFQRLDSDPTGTGTSSG